MRSSLCVMLTILCLTTLSGCYESHWVRNDDMTYRLNKDRGTHARSDISDAIRMKPKYLVVFSELNAMACFVTYRDKVEGTHVRYDIKGDYDDVLVYWDSSTGDKGEVSLIRVGKDYDLYQTISDNDVIIYYEKYSNANKTINADHLERCRALGGGLL